MRVLVLTEGCAQELASALGVTLPGTATAPDVTPVARKDCVMLKRPNGELVEYPDAKVVAKEHNMPELGAWGYCSILTTMKDAHGKPYMRERVSPYPFLYPPISTICNDFANYPEVADRVEYPDKWAAPAKPDPNFPNWDGIPGHPNDPWISGSKPADPANPTGEETPL